MVRVEPDDGDPDWARPGVFQVAAGVFRIPLPLPLDGLKAVNVYAVVDDQGAVLVDSGWAVAEARQALEKALAALGYGLGDVRRFLVTHVHRDHYAMAVTVRRELGSRVSLGAGEKPAIDLLSTPGADPLARSVPELVRSGAGDIVPWLREQVEVAGHDPAGWAPPDDWLDDGTELVLPDRTLQVVATPGHTQGHVVFCDKAAGLLFAGDHVLPHISPSVGFEVVPGPLPLGAFLDSLRLVRTMPDRRLLPAHGPIGDSVHARVDELLDHHGHRLAQAYHAIGADGATAYQVAERLTWTRRGKAFHDLDPMNQMVAVTETAAHLDLLCAQARLQVHDISDVSHYSWT